MTAHNCAIERSRRATTLARTKRCRPTPMICWLSMMVARVPCPADRLGCTLHTRAVAPSTLCPLERLLSQDQDGWPRTITWTIHPASVHTLCRVLLGKLRAMLHSLAMRKLHLKSWMGTLTLPLSPPTMLMLCWPHLPAAATKPWSGGASTEGRWCIRWTWR